VLTMDERARDDDNGADDPVDVVCMPAAPRARVGEAEEMETMTRMRGAHGSTGNETPSGRLEAPWPMVGGISSNTG